MERDVKTWERFSGRLRPFTLRDIHFSVKERLVNGFDCMVYVLLTSGSQSPLRCNSVDVGVQNVRAVKQGAGRGQSPPGV